MISDMAHGVMRLNEAQFKQVIRESAQRVVNQILESFDDDFEWQLRDGKDNLKDLSDILNDSYPGKNYSCRINDDGDVEAIDGEGNPYYGSIEQ
jgi:hypothetical protein